MTEMEPPVKSKSVSKSRLMDARQCLKKLWLATYRKEAAQVSDATKSRFARGHDVGAVARDQVPGGIFVDAPGDLRRALAETEAALKLSPRRAIFEATFSHGGCLVQVDALIPEGRRWRLCEVKSTSTSKPQHEADCAVQAWVAAGAGINLARTELVHLNPAFVYDGSGNYDGLFTFEAMDDKIRPLVEQVPAWIAEAQTVLAGPEPDIRTGAHCKKPYDCPFMAYCSAQEPPLPEYPVSLLPGNDGKTLARTLAAKGYADLRDVPAADIPAGKFHRIWQATRSGKPHLDPQAAKVLRALPWPRYYFDFETIDFAVPRWAGTRPWQQVPFQWSCHVETRDGSVTHKEFLDLSGENPARACVETMLQALGNTGAILVYYASFEAGRIRELAEKFPDLARKLTALLPRIVDLHPIVRDHYYHPAMKGSYSIKDVLPTMAPEMDYANLEGVRDGGMAQDAYLDAIAFGVDQLLGSCIANRLKSYCGHDTKAMLTVIAVLCSTGQTRQRSYENGCGS